MKKTTTIILLELVIIIILFFIIISLYKISYDKNETTQSFLLSGTSYNAYPISNNLFDGKTAALNLSQYKNEIINETVKEYDFFLKIGEKNGNGEIYIGTDNKIYLTLNDDIKKLSDFEFLTLYMPIPSNDYLYVYALSKEQKIYAISLFDVNINKTNFHAFQNDINVKNFTTLNIKSDFYLPTEIVVLTADNYLYQLSTGLKYTKNVFFTNQTYYLYSNGIVTNNFGYVLIDENGFEYKAKYCINADAIFEEIYMVPTSFLITEDNKLIFTLKNDFKVYELKENITGIELLDGDGETNSQKIILKFSNDKIIRLSGNVVKIENIDFS